MMIDPADAYGAGHNESLVGKALAACSADAFVKATRQRIFGLAKPGLAIGATLL